MKIPVPKNLLEQLKDKIKEQILDKIVEVTHTNDDYFDMELSDFTVTAKITFNFYIEEEA